MFKKILFSLFLSITFSVNAMEKEKFYEQAQFIMGSIIKVSFFYHDDLKVKNIFQKTFSELRKQDQIMSNYISDSELSKLLISAGKKTEKVSDDLFEVIDKSIYFSKITNGTFDITVAPLVELWGFKNKNFTKPPDSKIKEVLENIGYQNIIINKKNNTVFLKNSKIKIDLGAIGKGFAIDKAIKVLKNEGVSAGVIDALSSQYYLGNPPDKKFWKVGIKDPSDENKVLKYLEVKNQSVSSSGDYEQYFILNGKKYSHIISPASGYPINESSFVTVVSDNTTESDALSTCAILLDNQKIEKLVSDNFKNIQIYKFNQTQNGLKIFSYKN